MKEAQIIIPDVRAAIDLIYGPFGGGKNTLAAKLVKESLELGIPVFSSFPVRFEGYDQSKSRFSLLLRVLGLKRNFRIVPKENFHRLTMQDISSENFATELLHMQKCLVVIDEGYAARLLDSYRKTNMSVDARIAVYTTRHFDRRFIIVAQRPNAIHVSSRAMVNRFFRCSQPLGDNTPFSKLLWRLTGLRWFIFTEYQEMKDESVDEEKPFRTKWVFAGRRLLDYFDSKYMAEGYDNKYPSLATCVEMSWSEALSSLFGRRRAALAAGAASDGDSSMDLSEPILPKRSIRVISRS